MSLTWKQTNSLLRCLKKVGIWSPPLNHLHLDHLHLDHRHLNHLHLDRLHLHLGHLNNLHLGLLNLIMESMYHLLHPTILQDTGITFFSNFSFSAFCFNQVLYSRKFSTYQMEYSSKLLLATLCKVGYANRNVKNGTGNIKGHSCALSLCMQLAQFFMQILLMWMFSSTLAMSLVDLTHLYLLLVQVVRRFFSATHSKSNFPVTYRVCMPESFSTSFKQERNTI